MDTQCPEKTSTNDQLNENTDDQTDDQCPYTEEELEEMQREEYASKCDPEAWDLFKEAERRGFNPFQAVTNWYSGEPQEWEARKS